MFFKCGGIFIITINMALYSLQPNTKEIFCIEYIYILVDISSQSFRASLTFSSGISLISQSIFKTELCDLFVESNAFPNGFFN